MADAFWGSDDGTDPELLAEAREARRKLSMDRAMQELPQQVAGIPLVRYPAGTRPVPRSISERYPFAHVTGDLLTVEPKLALNRPQPDVVTPSEIMDELDEPGPGGGPGVIADLIEKNYGRLEDKPSWANSDQWARSGAEWAAGRSKASGNQVLANEYHKSQHLMSPARAAYMKDAGRRVDVLRNLRNDPERAMYFWDRSAPEMVRDGRPSERNLTRTETYDPIYQRFAEDNVSPFIASSSPIARVLARMNYVPAATGFYAAESPTWGDAFDRSYVSILAGDRTRSGSGQENPIADLPDGATPKQILDRQRELDERTALIQEPPRENVANSFVKFVYDNIPHVSASAWADRPLQPGEDVKPPAPNASGAVRDIIGFGRNYLDGSQLMGLLNPKAFVSELFRDAAREAAIEAGISTALTPALPEDPVAYVTKGLPSLPIDVDARRNASSAERADMILKPQSLFDSRMANDPVFARPVGGMASGLLDWLRSNYPSASAFGGQPTQR